MAKPRLWVTYCWQDNEDKDIDFILGALEASGEVEVRFDRRQLVPGQRLWEQIGEEIGNPDRCDAWAIVAAPGSLQSPACMEELAYALDRALAQRGPMFPLIGLLHRARVEQLPKPLQVRLCVPVGTGDWVSRTVAGAKGLAPGWVLEPVPDWHFNLHRTPAYSRAKFVLEVLPKFESFYPPRFGILEAERDRVRDWLFAPAERMPTGIPSTMVIEGPSAHPVYGNLLVRGQDANFDHGHSLWLYLDGLPTLLVVGRQSEQGQVNLRPLDMESIRRIVDGAR